jgi:hypothetical protein
VQTPPARAGDTRPRVEPTVPTGRHQHNTTGAAGHTSCAGETGLGTNPFNRDTNESTTTLTVMSWNVWLTRVAPEMHAMISELSPDFIVMSETKLTDRLHGKAYVKECAPGYHLRYSSAPHPNHGEYRTRSDAEVANRVGSGGVAVAFAARHSPTPMQ